MNQYLRAMTATRQVGAMFLIVLWVGWLSGDTTATVLFGLVSFFALREFLTRSPARRGDHRSLVLVFFVILPLHYVLVVQTCMVAQYFAGRRLRRAPAAPAISSSFNWPAWGIGVGAGSLLGALLAGVTPFAPGQAFAMAFVACVAGSLGHLVMKAIKRDRGIPSWGPEGVSVTGAGGLLDRVDALCFAAPVFFHSVRWYFQL